MCNSWLSALVLLTCVTFWDGVCVDARAPRCYRCNNTPVCTRRLFKPCQEAQSCSNDESMQCGNRCDVVGMFPVPDEPTKYYVCQYNEVTNRFDRRKEKCPPATTYNMRTMKCLTKAESNKLRHIPLVIQRGPKICKRRGKMPFEDDIKKYYECEYAGVYAKEVYCPANYYFDDKSNNCVHDLTPNLTDKMKRNFENLQVNANNLYMVVQRTKKHKKKQQTNYWPRIYFGELSLKTESPNEADFNPVNPSSVKGDDYTSSTPDKTSNSPQTSPSPSLRQTTELKSKPSINIMISRQNETRTSQSPGAVGTSKQSQTIKIQYGSDRKKIKEIRDIYKKLRDGVLTFPPEKSLTTSQTVKVPIPRSFSDTTKAPNGNESNLSPSIPKTKSEKPSSTTRIPPIPPFKSC